MKFVWVIESTARLAGKSRTYVVSPERYLGNPEDLHENVIWLVKARGSSRHLISKLSVMNTGMVDEPGLVGSLLIEGDPWESELLQPPDEANSLLKLDDISWAMDLPEGQLTTVTEVESSMLDQVANSIPTVFFSAPRLNVLDKVTFHPTGKPSHNWLIQAITTIKYEFYKSSLYRLRSHPLEWDGYYCVAYELLLSRFPKLGVDKVREWVKICSEPNSSGSVRKATDTNFLHLLPTEIKARKFRPAINKARSSDIAISTERAEYLHQELLRDLVTRAMAQGLQVVYSRSVDMAIQINSMWKIFELKSANCNNFDSQLAKGILQVGSYFMSLRDAGMNVVERCVVIYAINDNSKNDWSIAVGNELNTKVLLYRPNVEWPNRAIGFDDLLAN